MAHALPDGALPVPDGKWSDFSVRFISAAVLGPIALAALWFGGLAWAMLIGVAMAGLGMEWAKLAGQVNGRLSVLLALTWLAAVMLGFPAGFLVLAVLTAGVAWRQGRFSALGLPYAGIGGLSLLWLRLQPVQGFNDTLLVVIVVWSTDIGAYLIGRVVGGKKLAPRISPGKTWSGSIGGLAAGGLAGAVLAAMLHGQIGACALVAIVLSLGAQAGDLLESAIKRKLGVKDSGDTIPGHGGLFDRLDGFLAAAPLAAIFALWAQGGLPLWR